jgi:hypothetical protein
MGNIIRRCRDRGPICLRQAKKTRRQFQTSAATRLLPKRLIDRFNGDRIVCWPRPRKFRPNAGNIMMADEVAVTHYQGGLSKAAL